MRVRFVEVTVCVVAICALIMLGTPPAGAAQETPPMDSPPDAAASPQAIPSPSPDALPGAASNIRAGATYIGKTDTGAPVLFEVAADGGSIVWLTIGDADAVARANPTMGSILANRKVGSLSIIESPQTIAQLGSVPVFVFAPGCGVFSQGEQALWLYAQKDVPIIDGRLDSSDVMRTLEGGFEGDVLSGTFRYVPSLKEQCAETTPWSARASP